MSNEDGRDECSLTDSFSLNELERSMSASDGDETERIPTAFGRYKVSSLLGRGAFGTVYRGFDDTLNRQVAVKVPLAYREVDIHHYVEEAKKVASLEHPSIVPVYDAGISENGTCFVVSKYIDGRSLEGLLADRSVTRMHSVKIAADIAEALHFAHTRGIYHRDVKPANILLDHNAEHVFLADFGIAISENQIGQGSQCVGTPAYMSPEQATGRAHLVDGRTDVFSLGIVLYEMLTGRRPFGGTSTHEIIERIKVGRYRPLRQCDSSIDEKLEQIVSKALHVDLEKRYAAAQDMAVALREVLTATNERNPHPQSNRRLSRPIFTAAVVLFAAVFFAVASKWQPQNDTESVLVRREYQQVFESLDQSQPPTPTNGAALPPFAFVVMDKDEAEIRDGDSLVSGNGFEIAAYVSDACYLYVFQVDTSGQLAWLYPQNTACPFSAGSNPLPHGPTEIRLPGRGELFELDDQKGEESVFFIVSSTRWSQLESALGGGDLENHPVVALNSPMLKVPVRERGIRGIAGTKPKDDSNPRSRLYNLFQSTTHYAVARHWFYHR